MSAAFNMLMVHFKIYMTRPKRKREGKKIFFQGPKIKAGIQIGKLDEHLGTCAKIWDRRRTFFK